MNIRILEYLWTAFAFIVISRLNVLLATLNHIGWNGDIQNTHYSKNSYSMIRKCLLSGSRSMPLLYLPWKPSFEELQFNTKLIFWYFFYIISLKTIKWKKGVRDFFFVCIFYILVTFSNTIRVLFRSILSQLRNFMKNQGYFYSSDYLWYFIQSFG